MNISERIFKALKDRNKKQIDLAQWLNISISTVSDWKKFNRNPPAELIPKIASFLDVPLEFIFTDEEKLTNNGIIGTINSGLQKDIKIKINGEEIQLSEIEAELMRICKNLDIKGKHKLLDYAFKLEENK